MHRFRAIGAAAVLVAAVLLSGCDSGPATGEVSGSVSYDGKPIEIGKIDFFPEDGKSPTAGTFIKDGKYTAKVPVGKSKVVISGSKEVGQKLLYNTKNSPTRPVMADYLPAKYSEKDKTELSFEVKSGNNEKDWNLAK